MFKQIDVDDYNQLLNMICDSEKVFVVGVGRVMLMLQAFAKRLNHLGITANYVGAIDEPAITEKRFIDCRKWFWRKCGAFGYHESC